MKLTNKQYAKIVNAKLYVTIVYQTKVSSGMVEMKGAFLVEKYNKFFKLFKGVKIKDIFISDGMGIVYIHTEDLFNTWLYLIGRKDDEL